MTSIVETIQQIVRGELRSVGIAELGVVDAVSAHKDSSDNDNYGCDVRLKNTGLLLKRVPIMTGHLGSAAIPNVGDLVLLTFAKGDMNQPIVVGRLYTDDDRPPVNTGNELIMHLPLHAEDDKAIKTRVFKLADAQLVIAREYGLSNWTQLKERFGAGSAAAMVDAAIRADDREEVVRVLRANPKLLHIPVTSGNWGPPMSHAANMGRLEIIKAIAELGARDFQHAFDRDLLQGKIETARWLLQHGAELTPGIIMGFPSIDSGARRATSSPARACRPAA